LELKFISKTGGCKTKEISDSMKVQLTTIKRDLIFLKSLKLIEYKGSKKTGKYFITPEGKKLLSE